MFLKTNMNLKLNTKHSFKENITGEEINSSVCVELIGTELHFKYSIFDEEIYAPYQNDNDNLYDADVVEVFFSPNGDKGKYYEYELSPNGKRFFGLIENPTHKSPKLTRIDPAFKFDVQLTDVGYDCVLIIDTKEFNDFDIDKAVLNIYTINTKDGKQDLFALNPTFAPSFHLSDFLVPIEK